MTKQTETKLASLLKAIQSWGLMELVKESYCYQMVCRILDTGSDLQPAGEDTEADTEVSLAIVIEPLHWGIDDPLWREFTLAWGEA